MAEPRVFSVVRELARREVELHEKRIVGITTTAPEFKDVNGVLEFVVDVRIGTDDKAEIIRDVILSQWTVGIVSDINIPVLLEKSEAGRLTVIARSEVRLPDIVLTTYSFDELGFLFMNNLKLVSGVWRDGFGHAVSNPVGEVGVSTTKTFTIEKVPWDDTAWVWGEAASWGLTRTLFC